MDNFHVYKDMEARTKGEIYIGVVGPVRTGKSTFIKRSMSRDELPQSAAGKTIMTTEPKFIPKEAAAIQVGDGISVKIRLIDCVGFMAEGAAGHIEDDGERMVKTPWFENEIPFTKAAEIGTRKVIADHSTIGLVITSDGSFGDIRRAGYIDGERKAIEELKDNYVQYVREHPDSHVSLALLGMCDVEDVKELLPTLTDEVANGPLAVRYQAMSDALQQMQAREEAQKKVAEGNVAPDFTLKDLQGKDLSLSSLRGKYVVLDFWGSWCGWCIKGIPEMKKYYAKYKDRMEILGIDCRDTEEAWKAAVEKHELPWLHVRNDGEPDVTVMYAIQGFPTKIVIDPDGKIAKVVVGEDPAFYEYLDSLFK